MSVLYNRHCQPYAPFRVPAENFTVRTHIIDPWSIPRYLRGEANNTANLLHVLHVVVSINTWLWHRWCSPSARPLTHLLCFAHHVTNAGCTQVWHKWFRCQLHPVIHKKFLLFLVACPFTWHCITSLGLCKQKYGGSPKISCLSGGPTSPSLIQVLTTFLVPRYVLFLRHFLQHGTMSHLLISKYSLSYLN
jgi:hypothetical protein